MDSDALVDFQPCSHEVHVIKRNVCMLALLSRCKHGTALNTLCSLAFCGEIVSVSAVTEVSVIPAQAGIQPRTSKASATYACLAKLVDNRCLPCKRLTVLR